MPFARDRNRVLATLAVAAVAGAPGAAGISRAAFAATPTSTVAAARHHATDRHVLLISVDGMHESDLTSFLAAHPRSALARLVAGGRSFTSAQTPFPSDSFPGLVGQVTGGNPSTTGVYYDVSYNRRLLAPGTTACGSAKPGTVVAYDESLDRNTEALDAG